MEQTGANLKDANRAGSYRCVVRIPAWKRLILMERKKGPLWGPLGRAYGSHPPFPQGESTLQYTQDGYRLEAVGLGHIAISDCCVAEIDGDYPILKRLEKTVVNVDELDYLAKQLESFDPYELAQFQGAAVSCGYFSMRDLINLTFCCQEVTVVQDFTDLTAIGRKHDMDIYGGLTEAKQKTVDFRKTALSLLLTEEGKITPYGVAYDNGMKLEPIYDGLYFPD